MTYYAYTRVSTTRQGEQGVSLSAQRSATAEYADRHRLSVLAWFEDQESAAGTLRKQWSIMLKALQRGKAGGVIFHKIDRSARNLRDWAEVGELIDSGIDVHFVNENLELGSRGGRLTADIQAVVAADYVRNLREEVRKGIRERVQQGLIGWKVQSKVPSVHVDRPPRPGAARSRSSNHRSGSPPGLSQENLSALRLHS